MMHVLDTTAFSAVMRRDAGILSLLKKKQPGDFATVPPVVAEIEYGIRRVVAEIEYGIRRLDNSSRKYLRLNSEKKHLLSIIKVLPWLPESSKHFGIIKANFEQKGELIDDFDIAIAAIAISHQCSVLTANPRHFQRIENLEAIDW
ncbi:MAG: type II toxin-antitoxin system VapC family toxin [Deltaproteobacteria bacterium]|nr:type II toxin-antitoxin system VapC family toxin [Deltaproteobacteria bacterium]